MSLPGRRGIGRPPMLAPARRQCARPTNERRDGRSPGSPIIAFWPPSRSNLQWLVGRKLPAYSCGYSLGFAPSSLLATLLRRHHLPAFYRRSPAGVKQQLLQPQQLLPMPLAAARPQAGLLFLALCLCPPRGRRMNPSVGLGGGSCRRRSHEAGISKELKLAADRDGSEVYAPHSLDSGLERML